MKIKEQYDKKLLVEGNDDQHVVWALCEKHKIPQNFDVIDCEGIDNLVERLSVTGKLPETKAVGIIVDADTDLQGRWDSLKVILRIMNPCIPEDLPEKGLIAEYDTRKVGVWIMPDNNTKGMLEDFISFLVPKGDGLLPVVDNTLNDMEKRKLNKYSLIHKSKARIHTWLAWQEDPGTPMGLSITKRYLSADSDTCRHFVDWLTELFE
jgi:hypothetical protein